MSRPLPDDLFALYSSLTESEKRELSDLIERMVPAERPGGPGASHTHRVRGRLLHMEEPRPPLHGLTTEVWRRDPLSPDRFLGRSTAGSDGGFAVSFALPEADRNQALQADLRILAADPSFSSAGEVVEHAQMIHHLEFDLPAGRAEHDCGTIELPFWEYARGTVLPRLMLTTGETLQDLARGRKIALERQVSELTATRSRHQRLSGRNETALTLDAVQHDFPENLTRRLEREEPGSTRTDRFLGERVLNGSHPLLLRPVGTGLLRASLTWDSCEFDARYDLPNLDSHFQLDGVELRPVRITLQFREAGGLAPYSPLEPPHDYTPADGEGWEQAKRFFRMVWGVSGEVDFNLGRCHLNMEQYAIAAWRNLRRNPVRLLLFPHLKEVVVINNSTYPMLRDVVTINSHGEDVELGETGFLQTATGLSAGGVIQRLREQLSRWDWYGWRPRRPVSPLHRFAQAGELYWELLTRHVEEFFAAHRSEIEQNWWEVRRFSDDLVAHSVPYGAPEQGSEEACPDAPRVVVGGETRAVSPVTGSDSPCPTGLENLKQLCRYLIFQATYAHSHFSARLYEDRGEIAFCSLGLRRSGTGPVAAVGGPHPLDASRSLFMARIQSETRYGTIVRNEDGDIPLRLVELLRGERPAFDALGVDVGEIGSRINI